MRQTLATNAALQKEITVSDICLNCVLFMLIKCLLLCYYLRTIQSLRESMEQLEAKHKAAERKLKAQCESQQQRLTTLMQKNKVGV